MGTPHIRKANNPHIGPQKFKTSHPERERIQEKPRSRYKQTEKSVQDEAKTISHSSDQNA